MNSSPVAHTSSSQNYVTPSRKPTEHHCNADRKPRPQVRPIDSLIDVHCKNLFEDKENLAQAERGNVQMGNVKAKLFRWMLYSKKMIINMSLLLWVWVRFIDWNVSLLIWACLLYLINTYVNHWNSDEENHVRIIWSTKPPI